MNPLPFDAPELVGTDRQRFSPVSQFIRGDFLSFPDLFNKTAIFGQGLLEGGEGLRSGEKLQVFCQVVDQGVNLAEIFQPLNQALLVAIDNRITSYNVCYTKLLRR